MTALRFLALSQARLALALLRHALEDLEKEPALEAYEVSELARLRHVVVDWQAFVEALVKVER
jgi:hypothetical protein